MDNRFLPVSKKDMEAAGIKQLDFVYVIGDAYVDHPSFGPAIISRVLQSRGYTVGIIAQPDWKVDESITILGEPRLGFLISSGNMDSMVNHYTVAKKRRHTDAYSPDGRSDCRPDRAVTVYSNLVRKTYKHTPVILGGIEASLRRFAHYDYWSNQLKRSVLLDSGADIISYGMGEHAIVEIADALDSGIDIHDITFIKGTVYRTKQLPQIPDALMLPSYEKLLEDKLNYARSFNIQHRNTDPFQGKTLIESYEKQGYLVQNPAALPLTTQEMDDVYDLPYTNACHPMYEKLGKIPAIEEIKFSITSNRGCFGGCNFCALTFHQGRIVQVRSHESILKEAKEYTNDPEFKGYIHDVGGPTADFRQPACEKQLKKGACTNRQCLFPTPCDHLKADHKDYLQLLEKLRKLPKVKKVFIRSGIRFDYVLKDSNDNFIKDLVNYHVSGQLRVAPEHVSNQVLDKMGKPCHEVYETFLKKFKTYNQACGKKQFAVPYFMSSHPGCTLNDAIELAEYVRDMGFMPEQVQDFYPTPSTMSTCMYYTGVDPATMQKIYVPRDVKEKAMQRALIQFKNPANYDIVYTALKKAGRDDLIGFDKHCLIRPRRQYSTGSVATGNKVSEKQNKPSKSKNIKARNTKNANTKNTNTDIPRKKKAIRNVHKKK